MPRPPDPDAEVDALYRLALADFTAARNALAARLRKDGRKDAASGVAALAKPSASAWAVNQLHWSEGPQLSSFFAAVAALREAQRAGRPETFREAQRARREALQGLLRSAERILADAGHAVTPALLGRVSGTLEALAGGSAAPLGRLVEDLQPPGFDAFAGALVTPPTPAAPARGEGGQARAEAIERQTARTRAKAAVAEAEAELRRLRRASSAAAGRADAARRAQQEAEESLAAAATRARKSAEAAERASFEARQAETALAEAQRGLEAARLALDRLR